MQTPWGQLEVADAHVHFFSHNFFQLLSQQGEHLRSLTVSEIAARLGWDAPPETAAGPGDRWVGELDRNLISQAVLSASLPGDEQSVSSVLLRHPERFWGYFFFNPLAPQVETRLENAAAAGFRGACLFPAMHGYLLSAPEVSQSLDSCARLKLRVFIHCGVLSVGVRKRLGLPSRFDMRFSNPIDLHPVALRYEDVRFVVPHFGAGYFREALMLAALCPNVYFDTSSSTDWLKQVFAHALDVAGANRLLFGTDSSFFPRGWNRAIFSAQVEALTQLGASREDAAAILGGNLRHLLAD